MCHFKQLLTFTGNVSNSNNFHCFTTACLCFQFQLWLQVPDREAKNSPAIISNFAYLMQVTATARLCTKGSQPFASHRAKQGYQSYVIIEKPHCAGSFHGYLHSSYQVMREHTILLVRSALLRHNNPKILQCIPLHSNIHELNASLLDPKLRGLFLASPGNTERC